MTITRSTHPFVTVAAHLSEVMSLIVSAVDRGTDLDPRNSVHVTAALTAEAFVLQAISNLTAAVRALTPHMPAQEKP